MTKLPLNSRMPYMLFNWAQHDTRTSHLTYEERGMFDVARSTLWQVEGCRMPLDVLKLRLRIEPDTAADKLLGTLVALDLLTVDDDGLVYDDVQVREFEAAVQKAEINRENGKKGGRPRRQPDLPPPPPSHGGGLVPPDF